MSKPKAFCQTCFSSLPVMQWCTSPLPFKEKKKEKKKVFAES